MKKISFSCFSLIVIFLFFTTFLYANPVKEIYEEGLAAFSNQDYSRAIELFEKALTYYPKLAPAYNYIGLAQKALNRSIESIRMSFEKAIEADPSYAPSYDNLSKYYYALGQFDTAESYGLQAIALNPDEVSSYLTLGWTCLIGQGNAKKAISHFEKALTLTDFLYVYFGLGIAYYMDGQNYKVLDMITRLREKNEEDLALKLEILLRSGTYNPSQYKDFVGMLITTGIFTAETAPSASNNIRVSEPLKTSPSVEPSVAQRMLELQKRGADFYDTDLYY
ncbi:MAG TPA: tetratricopeptide repeat protein [Candidatus Omnitrophota bacterium]|nr:tetratricopeptide repeat protein [Candidatus Omnitrophota bacterium]